MKRVALLALGALLLGACTETKGGAVERKDSITVATQQEIYQNGQPVPVFDYSQTRQTMIDIYKAKVRGVATWSVVYSFGKPGWSCPSIGYPVPATTQLTNPEQLARVDPDPGKPIVGNLPQAEPDGVFTGATAATYILCVRPDGSVNAVYSEPEVVAFPFPVEVRDGAVVDSGKAASYTVTIR